MRGTARRITIIVLLLLMVVLAVLAVVLWNIISNRNNIDAKVVNGGACQQNAAATCEAGSTGSNTGYLCNCISSGGSFKWDCSSYDTQKCSPTGQSCNQGETSSGDCGTSGCAANQRPLRTCGADNKFTEAQCQVDPTCTGSSSSSSSTTSVSSSTSTSSSTSSVSSSSSSAASCAIEVSELTKTIDIAASCDSAFTYTVRKHIVDSPTADADGDCANTSVANPIAIAARPGEEYSISAEACGKCVKIELLSAPAGSTPSTGPFSITGFTKVCAAASTSSSSSSAAATSSSTSTLPSTGLFDGDSNALLAGLMLITSGLIVNRLFPILDLGRNRPARMSYEDRIVSDYE